MRSELDFCQLAPSPRSIPADGLFETSSNLSQTMDSSTLASRSPTSSTSDTALAWLGADLHEHASTSGTQIPSAALCVARALERSASASSFPLPHSGGTATS